LKNLPPSCWPSAYEGGFDGTLHLKKEVRVILTNIHRAFRPSHAYSGETDVEQAGGIPQPLPVVAESWKDSFKWRAYAGKSDWEHFQAMGERTRSTF